MPTKFLGVSLAATIAFAIFLTLPALFAGFVVSGEIDAFRLGVSTEPTKAYDTDADIGSGDLREANPVVTIPDANVFTVCDVVATETSRADGAIATNISTPLTTFGDGYYSYVITTPVGCDGNPTTVGTADFSRMEWLFEVDVDEFVGSEVFSFVAHLQTNVTFSFFQLTVATVSVPGTLIAPIVDISPALDNPTVDSGEIVDFLLTTQDRLLVQGSFPSGVVGERMVLRVIAFLDFTDLPPSGEVVIFDGELSTTRDKILTGTGSIILFNVVWSLVAVPVILAATPWITWKDIVTLGRGRRGG